MRDWPIRLLPAVVGSLLTLGTAAAAEPPGAPACGRFAFREAAVEAGVAFRHETGATGAKHLPETMGAGVAWLDYDGDGWLDLYVVQSGHFPPGGEAAGGNVLFRNLGGGRFGAVSGRGMEGRGYGQGVLAADLDGDGDQDLLLTNYGPDALLVNGGDGHFLDRTAESGLGAAGWSSSAAAADADGDGDLDLYVTRYLVFDPEEKIFCGDPETGRREYCDPSMFPGAGDLFYRNLGDGRFRVDTAAAGVGPADGRGLGVAFTDLDGDLTADLYVANDLTVNFLFANRGDGTFEDLSLLSGAAVNRDGRAEAGMGVAVGDIDGDLDPDLLVTNFDVETNTFYRNLGGLVFSDDSGSSGFGLPSFNQLAFGVVAADFDRDGQLDVYVANGHIFEQPERENVRYRQPDQVLAGEGGAFVTVPCGILEGRPTVARGLAAGDYDNDGDPDLAIQENGGPLRLLENTGVSGDWVGVQLLGRAPNTDAVGSRLALRTEEGTQMRWVTAGDSYQSSSDRRNLFGVGDAGVEELEVAWPDGRRSRLVRPPAGRYLVLSQPGR